MKGLNLTVSDIGNDATALTIQADPVRDSAEVSEKIRPAISLDRGDLPPSVGGIEAAIMQGHYSFRPQKSLPEGLNHG
jgi:hypothetical protein